jgi:AraC-like DNA-binding protein
LTRQLDAKGTADMREALGALLERIERKRVSLKIPKAIARLQRHPSMHYHFKPEAFLQIGGTTEFTTPKEKLLLRPGEFLLMPAGVPHKEFVEAGRREAFRNLVIGFYNRTLSLHFAHEVAPGTPDIETIEFFDAPDLDAFITMANQMVASYHGHALMHHVVVRGLLMALVGKCLNLLETSGSQINQDIGKIFQAKWLVREQLQNPELNVKHVAARLKCSPDYLSHLFRNKTGEKLIQYIQRMRIIGAMAALETTNLYVSEIAWSSGFQDPAYFARVFKKFTGKTPQEYRDSLHHMGDDSEPVPKTIYFDREDFSHGSPLPGS